MHPILPIYYLHILQGQWSAFQVLVLVLNSLRDTQYFFEFNGRSHKLGARGENRGNRDALMFDTVLNMSPVIVQIVLLVQRFLNVI